MYAIVDIETTGGYAAANGITEISIHVFDGKTVIEKFETLINPNQPIPYFISAMTGISDKMVANAPRFEEVAEKVHRILSENIFIVLLSYVCSSSYYSTLIFSSLLFTISFVLSLLLIIHLLFPFSTVLLSYLLISPLYLFPILILVL